MDRQAPRDDLLADTDLPLPVLDPLQQLGMSSRQLADANRFLHFAGKVEERDKVSDAGASQPETLGQLFVSDLEARQVILEALGFFDGIEVGPVNVLDQG